MSRSNPTEGARNPSTRWFEWAGGSDGGFVRWYDKENKQHVRADNFTFLLLDELSTVKGWHEPSGSAIYANEVRDLRQESLVVRSFNGGELASGFYGDIKDRIAAKGGHWAASIYIASKDEAGALAIANLSLKGAAAGAWMDFKKSAPTKKDANGKNIKAYFLDAISITGFEDAKKGGTAYRVPTFGLRQVSEATQAQAVALDAELQAFISDYLKRPKAEAAKPAPTNGDTHEMDAQPPAKRDAFADFESDIPY